MLSKSFCKNIAGVQSEINLLFIQRITVLFTFFEAVI